MKNVSLILVCVWLLGAGLAGAAGPVGWRTDGTGRYPNATPPTKWSATENIVWKTPMPDLSNSTPVIVGDKLFVCADKNTLLCVNLADGKILWQKANEYTDTLAPAELAKFKEVQPVLQSLGEMKGKLQNLENQIKQDPARVELYPQIADLYVQIGNAQKEKSPLLAESRAFANRLDLPPTNPTNGYSTPTPVSDGKNVYVLFGTGVAACYDLDGNRKWVKLVEKPNHGWGHSASPVLVGDRLIVHIMNVFALDAATGETRWQQSSQMGWGTEIPAKVGDIDVIITPMGDIVKVADGAVLARKVSKLDFCAPILQDGVVYFIEHGGRAIKLPSAVQPEFKPVVLWETKPANERYYASPVYHEGLIYAIQQQSVLSAIDAATGQVVYEQKLNLAGTVYPSLAFAGGYLFASSEGGMTVVFKPGRKYEEVARNNLEAFRSSPVFDGKRLYIRAMKTLYCIGQ